MAHRRAKSLSSKRLHVVLVPGFAGFDTLGQLEYYGNITPLFPRPAGNEVLHYFDNFPTAAVITRAMRLRRYLAKRIARGSISANDDVVLLGHSTGGLDIRWLLWDLRHNEQAIAVDGTTVAPEEILEPVRRVVFLSVPHWGTNIADWVKDQRVARKAVVDGLRAAVEGSQLLLLELIENTIIGGAARLTGAALLRAVQDALSEANEYDGRPSPMRTADAQEAASQLELYLRHMASDFGAIDDLTSRPRQNGEPVSPAHFDAGHREKERECDIEFRSYVTIGRRPFRFDPGPQPPWEPAMPWNWPEIAEDIALDKGTDIVYRICYRACAGGPFRQPPGSGKVTQRWPGAPQHRIELWDNDGIVNTMSMLWPRGEKRAGPWRPYGHRRTL